MYSNASISGDDYRYNTWLLFKKQMVFFGGTISLSWCCHHSFFITLKCNSRL